jgi:hypothetical protein
LYPAGFPKSLLLFLLQEVEDPATPRLTGTRAAMTSVVAGRGAAWQAVAGRGTAWQAAAERAVAGRGARERAAVEKAVAGQAEVRRGATAAGKISGGGGDSSFRGKTGEEGQHKEGQ